MYRLCQWIKVIDVIPNIHPKPFELHMAKCRFITYYIYYYVNYSMWDVIVLNKIAQQMTSSNQCIRTRDMGAESQC